MSDGCSLPNSPNEFTRIRLCLLLLLLERSRTGGWSKIAVRPRVTGATIAGVAVACSISTIFRAQEPDAWARLERNGDGDGAS